MIPCVTVSCIHPSIHPSNHPCHCVRQYLLLMKEFAHQLRKEQHLAEDGEPLSPEQQPVHEDVMKTLADIQKAKILVETVAQDINESMRRQSDLQVLIELQKEFEKADLVMEGRRLILQEGPLKVSDAEEHLLKSGAGGALSPAISGKQTGSGDEVGPGVESRDSSSDPSRQLYIFLFNDLLILASGKKKKLLGKGIGYTFREQLNLRGMQIESHQGAPPPALPLQLGDEVVSTPARKFQPAKPAPPTRNPNLSPTELLLRYHGPWGKSKETVVHFPDAQT